MGVTILPMVPERRDRSWSKAATAMMVEESLTVFLRLLMLIINIGAVSFRSLLTSRHCLGSQVPLAEQQPHAKCQLRRGGEGLLYK